MTRLLSGELRRVLARRMVRVLAVLAVVIIAVAGVATFVHARATTDQALAAERARVASGLPVGACPEFKVGPGRPGGPVPVGPGPGGVSPGGGPCFFPVFVRDPRFHLHSLRGILVGVTAPLVIAGWIIGASVIGADWQSRTLATILTWESRRRRVLVAKVLGAMVVSALLALATFALLTLALLPAAHFRGTAAGTSGSWWRSVDGAGLRGMAMTAMATGIGFSIAAVGRSTAAALGADFGYVIVIEQVVGRFLEGFRRWLFLGNTIVFVSGHKGGGGVPGRTVAAAALFLVAVTAGLFVISGETFARRDVN